MEGANVNGTAFLISNSIVHCLASVYKPGILQPCYNCLLVPGDFFVNSLGITINIGNRVTCKQRLFYYFLPNKYIFYSLSSPYCISKDFQYDSEKLW